MVKIDISIHCEKTFGRCILDMAITETEAKSILRKHKRIDSWFVSRYGLNLYRGCLHNCVYCDGRAEKYAVDGEFGRDITVKTNALEILQRELDPKRKRKPLKQGFFMLGGGVGDSYQQVEKDYRLTRQAMELIASCGFPIHILTKSTLVERDLDLLRDINSKSRVIVSMSFSSVDETVSRQFEPGVPTPIDRLSVLSRLRQKGIACGMFLMPVIPFVTDTPAMMDRSVAAAVKAKLDFVIFGGMTLKSGRQSEHFYSFLKKTYPHLLADYHAVYGHQDKWGGASGEYYDEIHRRFAWSAGRHKIPVRIPLPLFGDFMDMNDRVVVILDHMDYLLKLQGAKSPYGFAAYSLSQLKDPLTEFKGSLRQLKGVGKVTERVIKEILNTGTSRYYESLMNLRPVM